MLKTIPYYFYQVDAIEDWLDEQEIGRAHV